MLAKKPTIVLIQPPCLTIADDHIEQNLGLAYIASYLKQYNYSVEIIHLTGNRRDHGKALWASIPYAHIYGISCYSTSYNHVKAIVSHLKAYHANAYICLGGPHPTALPEETLIELDVDSVVVGDGEIAFLSIVQNWEQGIPPRGVISGIPPVHLDHLPFPCHDPIEQNTFTRIFCGKKTASLISSRGCRFKCLHCNSVVMGGYRKNVMFRSVRHIIDEIEFLKSLGYTALRFNDDNFGDHPDLVHLLECIKHEKIAYRVFSRLEHLTPKNCQLLAESGCRFVSIGLESMQEDNLRFLGKSNILQHLSNLKYTQQWGITVRSSFMVGLPYDTDTSIESAFNLAAQLDFQEFAIYPLIPYPGTRIWSNPTQYHYVIANKNYNDYIQMGISKSTCFALQHTDPVSGYTFYPHDVERWYQRAHKILGQKKIHTSESEIAR